MTPLLEQVFDEIRGCWRHRWAAMGAAFVLAIVGWTVVFALPDLYEANARVFVDTRTALRPALQGLTVEQDVNTQLNFVRQSLLAGPQLRRIAIESGVLPQSLDDPRRESQILNKFTDRITLTVHSASEREEDRNAGSIYDIGYLDGDRARALKVVKILVNTFVDQTLDDKRAGAEHAQDFLEIQIKDYEKRLHAAEERLAEFKKRNIGLMPTDQGGYFSQLQNELDAVKKSQTSLSIAVTRRAELHKQLVGEAVVSAAGPSTMIGPNGTVTGGSDTLTRIKETQARLDELLLKFTDKHPEVIATRQTLQELKQRRATELESLRRGDAAAVASSGASSNPVYQSIQLAINQADVEIAALRGELQQHQAKAAELRKFLDSAPQVEAEFAQLNRDYDVNKAQYTTLLANYQKARMGERADNAGSVRFEVVQPPEASFKPVSPQRRLLLILLLLASVAAGGGLAYGLNFLQPIVGSASRLTELTGLPVIGTVGGAFPGRWRAERTREGNLFAGAVACLLAAFVVAVILDHEGLRLSISALSNLVKV